MARPVGACLLLIDGLARRHDLDQALWRAAAAPTAELGATPAATPAATLAAAALAAAALAAALLRRWSAPDHTAEDAAASVAAALAAASTESDRKEAMPAIGTFRVAVLRGVTAAAVHAAHTLRPRLIRRAVHVPSPAASDAPALRHVGRRQAALGTLAVPVADAAAYATHADASIDHAVTALVSTAQADEAHLFRAIAGAMVGGATEEAHGAQLGELVTPLHLRLNVPIARHLRHWPYIASGGYCQGQVPTSERPPVDPFGAI